MAKKFTEKQQEKISSILEDEDKMMDLFEKIPQSFKDVGFSGPEIKKIFTILLIRLNNDEEIDNSTTETITVLIKKIFGL